MASLLDPMEAAHKLRWGDRGDLVPADPRKDVDLKMPADLLRIAGRPLAVLLGLREPGAREQLEGVEVRDPLALSYLAALDPGVNALRQLLGLGTRLLARGG